MAKQPSRTSDANGRELMRIGERMFADKLFLDHLWQNLAEEFYPERANFTHTLRDGDEYARHLIEATPAVNRRDLSKAIGYMMRPDDQSWFWPKASEEWRNTDKSKAWFDDKAAIMRRFIYARGTNFDLVNSVADDDFVAFGNSVLSRTENRARNGFIYRDHHLRDVAWSHNDELKVDRLHRKFKISLRNFVQRWGEDKLSESQKRRKKVNPFEEIEIRHVAMPAAEYDCYAESKRRVRGKQFVSIYFCPEQSRVIHEGGYFEFPYLVRRWDVSSESAYGRSPAAMLGLIEARKLQSQSHVILDAAERTVDPALIANRNAVEDYAVNSEPGTITWIDAESDDAAKSALYALQTGGDIKLGLEMLADTRQMLAAAMYINKLSLPTDKDMTAYEVGERLQEYLRSIKPVIRPFRSTNQDTLHDAWSALMRITIDLERGGMIGPFGPLEDMPKELIADGGADIDWRFDGPVEKAYERLTAIKARETAEFYGDLMRINPSVGDNVDWDQLARDGSEALGGKARWQLPMEIVQETRATKARAAQEQAQMAKISAGIDMAGRAGEAMPAIEAGAQSLSRMMPGPSHKAPDVSGMPTTEQVA